MATSRDQSSGNTPTDLVASPDYLGMGVLVFGDDPYWSICVAHLLLQNDVGFIGINGAKWMLRFYGNNQERKAIG